MDKREAALAASDEIERLMISVGHPMRLRDVGVPEEGLEACSMHAAGDPVSLYNARPVAAPAEILELYRQVY